MTDWATRGSGRALHAVSGAGARSAPLSISAPRRATAPRRTRRTRRASAARWRGCAGGRWGRPSARDKINLIVQAPELGEEVEVGARKPEPSSRRSSWATRPIWSWRLPSRARRPMFEQGGQGQGRHAGTGPRSASHGFKRQWMRLTSLLFLCFINTQSVTVLLILELSQDNADRGPVPSCRPCP